MSQNTIHVGTLTKLIRSRNSNSGNPRWTLIVDGHRYVTKPDAAVSYELTESMVGKAVSITCDPKGRVFDVEVLPGQAPEGR